MEEDTEPPRRAPPPPGRSQFSSNWRTKDPTPRADPAPQTQSRNNQRSFNSNRRDPQDPTSPTTAAPDSPTASGTRLYVGNLLYTASRADVESLFTQNGFNIAGISMSVDPFTGRNPSYAFVDFESAEDASRAMETLNGMEVLGRGVKINPGVRRDVNGAGAGGGNGVQQTRVRNYDGNRRGRDERGELPSNYKPTFDRWSRTDASSHWNSPQENGTRLYVGNLPRIEPQSAADAQMQEIFASEGFELTAVSKMISPHPSKASEPGNHYYCFVDLATPEDAERAMEALNGREVEGWGAIRVSKARNNLDRKVNREQFGYSKPDGEGRRDGAAWRKASEAQE